MYNILVILCAIYIIAINIGKMNSDDIKNTGYVIAMSVVVILLLIHIGALKCNCSQPCACYMWCNCAKDTQGKCICVAGTPQAEGLLNPTRVVRFHYTTWCGFCKKAKPIFMQLTNDLRDTGIVFDMRDEDKSPTPGVTRYPTIIMTATNGYRNEYNGTVTYDDLRRWIITPIP